MVIHGNESKNGNLNIIFLFFINVKKEHYGSMVFYTLFMQKKINNIFQ